MRIACAEAFAQVPDRSPTMIYLKSFHFPDGDREFDFLLKEKRQCYDTFYPFKILSRHRFEQMDFEPVTIVYGGNGSGKSTALNVIAEKLSLSRDTIFNKSNFFPDYLKLCSAEIIGKIPAGSRIITSDDVFDYMLNIRTLNEGIDRKRALLFQEYLDIKYSSFQMKSLDDYEQLKRKNRARSSTQSQFVRKELMDNIREYSNGESAFLYFSEKNGETACFFWTSRRTASPLPASRSWFVLSRTLPASLAASLSSPPIRLSCWPSGTRKFTTWTRIRWM